MKSARVITTFECNRNCPYCSNNYESLISQGREVEKILSLAEKYDEIIVTGGEPMLYPYDTLELIDGFKYVNPEVKVYLYTALYHEIIQSSNLLDLVDGITYTLHENATLKDVYDFIVFQDDIHFYRDREKTFRAFINNKLSKSVEIDPQVWDRVKVSGTLSEGECNYPEDDLIIYTGGYFYDTR